MSEIIISEPLVGKSRADLRLDKFLKHPKKAVWIVAAPMMAGFTVHSLYIIVDAAFIGKLGAEALAAATYIGAVFFAAIAMTNGLATGITAAVAMAFGNRDNSKRDHLASNGLTIGVLLGGAFVFLGVEFGQWLISVMGAEGKSATLAWDYMLPLCMGMPLFFISTSIRAVLNGEGDAKTPMIILASSTVLNVVLDPIFIFALDMGITGAAYATIFAQFFATIALVYLAIIRGRAISRFRVRLMFPNLNIIRPIIKVGLPAAVGHMIMALGMGLINRVVAEFGQLAVAGVGAGTKVDMIVTLPILGLASAAVTTTGIFAGAGRVDLVRSTALYTYYWAIAFAVLLGGGAYFASETIVGIFLKEQEAIDVGVKYISYVFFAYPLMAVGMTSGRLLQGLGYGMPALIVTTIRVLFFGVACSYTAVYLFKAPIESIWLSFIAGGFVSGMLAVFWVRKFMWKQDLVK